MPGMPPVDPRALVRGAVLSSVVWLPLALVSAIVIDEGHPSAWAVPLFLGVLVGLVASGWIASGAARSSPLVTGALAGLGGYLVVQAIGVARRLVSGDDVRWTNIVGTAVLAYGCGLTGAVLGERLGHRRGDGIASR
jgi:putative membrane protein (TIGR04086 family)